MKSGFLTIIGPTNAGKSTLLNSLLNTDLNIVSARPQTTRNNVAGIITDKEKGIQLVITDTPGILKKSKSLLDQKLYDTVLHAIDDTDIVLFLFPPEDSLTNYKDILEKIKSKKQVIAVLNKTDQQDRDLTGDEKALGLDWIKISGLKKRNLEEIFKKVEPFLLENTQYYPDDVLSDRTERFFAKEYVREAILNFLHDEIPHQVFVDIDNMEEDNGLYRIEGVIYTERENHKKILVGKGGEMIKKIGTFARKKIEALCGIKVYLGLTVKVKEKWRDNPEFLKKLEYY